MDENNQPQAPQPPMQPEQQQPQPQAPQAGPAPVYAQPAPNQQPQAPASSTTDVFGIISLVMIFVGAQLIGVILGYIGMKKAAKEGYNGTLSKIGFWVNLVFTIIFTLVFILWIILIVAAGSQNT